MQNIYKIINDRLKHNYIGGRKNNGCTWKWSAKVRCKEECRKAKYIRTNGTIDQKSVV